MRKIATEEAFSIPEIAAALAELSRHPNDSLDMPLVRDLYAGGKDLPVDFVGLLTDLQDQRLKTMDANGVDMHVLSLTAPGVQMFPAPQAVDFARLANDRLAQVVQRHPTRFAGLASFAPQDVAASVK